MLIHQSFVLLPSLHNQLQCLYARVSAATHQVSAHSEVPRPVTLSCGAKWMYTTEKQVKA
jgi:hypothetical protein